MNVLQYTDLYTAVELSHQKNWIFFGQGPEEGGRGRYISRLYIYRPSGCGTVVRYYIYSFGML
jgi:hypothetical protein